MASGIGFALICIVLGSLYCCSVNYFEDERRLQNAGEVKE